MHNVCTCTCTDVHMCTYIHMYSPSLHHFLSLCSFLFPLLTLPLPPSLPFYSPSFSDCSFIEFIEEELQAHCSPSSATSSAHQTTASSSAQLPGKTLMHCTCTSVQCLPVHTVLYIVHAVQYTCMYMYMYIYMYMYMYSIYMYCICTHVHVHVQYNVEYTVYAYTHCTFTNVLCTVYMYMYMYMYVV